VHLRDSAHPAWGIVRQDGLHNWWELHPLIGWDPGDVLDRQPPPEAPGAEATGSTDTIGLQRLFGGEVGLIETTLTDGVNWR